MLTVGSNYYNGVTLDDVTIKDNEDGAAKYQR